MRKWRAATLLAAALVAVGCGSERARPGPVDPDTEPTGLEPLTDLGSGRYLGQYVGGLFPGGANGIPTDHALVGGQAAARIRPLDGSGTPSANGRIAVLVVGASVAAQVACSVSSNESCMDGTLLERAGADAALDPRVVFVNGARFNSVYQSWNSAASAYYQGLRTTVLPAAGVAAPQVQAAWIHLASTNPAATLPAGDADAIAMLRWLGEVLRALKQNFPNLHVAWITSRIYGGYGQLSPLKEPSAYETGFAVKWTIEAQIRQERTGEVVIEEAGNLAPDQAAPWITWGPYWWADGPRPRDDGLTWPREYFEQDGVSPAPPAEQRMAGMVLDHLKASPFARCWLLSAVTCQ